MKHGSIRSEVQGEYSFYKRFQIIVSFVSGLSAMFLCARPAFANIPVGWAIIGNNASLSAGISTKGISFIVVMLIECLVFWRYCQCSWRKAVAAALVLNLISTIAGVVITAPFLAFPGGEILVFPIAVYIISKATNAPMRFTALSFVTVVIGIIGAFINYAVLIPPKPPIRIFVALLLPLCLGFGVTIMIEAAAAKLFYDPIKIWKGVLIANVCSYLFLVLMLPFFFPNPYGGLTRMKLKKVVTRLEEGREKEELIHLLHHFRASNLFLLGFTDNDAPYKMPYEPDTERWLMRVLREENKPELADAIQRDIDILQRRETR